MSTVRIHFHSIHQDSQDFGSDDDHMVSRIFMDVELDGELHKDVHADIKQTIGTDYSKAGLEVSKPVGYKGPWNHEAFSKAAEGYFRSFIRISGAGSMRARMRDNRFTSPQQAEFEVTASGGTW